MKRLSHRIVLGGIASLTPLVGLAVWFVLNDDYPPAMRWLVGILSALSLLIFVGVVRTQIDYPLRTLANLISAVREEDYSFRARGAHRDDAMGEVMTELNQLSDVLREQRRGEVDAAALVRSAVEEIDSAIFTFDDGRRLRLVNRAGQRLLGRPFEQLAGRTAAELGLDGFLTGEDTRMADVVLPGGHGRFRIRRSRFRQAGVPHVLLSVSDLSRALREEERQAWQRLLRVLSHELNNSLAPIRSIADTLSSILSRDSLPARWREDAQRGLAVIGSRAEGLTRFMQGYSQLAKLPQPVLAPMNVGETVRRVARLETRMPVAVDGPDLTIRADRDQIEQLLINLVRNAADAALETGGSVRVEWSALTDSIEFRVIDEGKGIGGTANLFVPFFTTKPGGNGIGLALARQIAEAHEGVLTLSNRPAPATGTIARLRLPR